MPREVRRHGGRSAMSEEEVESHNDPRSMRRSSRSRSRSTMSTNRFSPFQRYSPKMDSSDERSMSLNQSHLLESKTNNILENGKKCARFPLQLLKMCVNTVANFQDKASAARVQKTRPESGPGCSEEESDEDGDVSSDETDSATEDCQNENVNNSGGNNLGDYAINGGVAMNMSIDLGNILERSLMRPITPEEPMDISMDDLNLTGKSEQTKLLDSKMVTPEMLVKIPRPYHRTTPVRAIKPRQLNLEDESRRAIETPRSGREITSLENAESQGQIHRGSVDLKKETGPRQDTSQVEFLRVFQFYRDIAEQQGVQRVHRSVQEVKTDNGIPSGSTIRDDDASSMSSSGSFEWSDREDSSSGDEEIAKIFKTHCNSSDEDPDSLPTGDIIYRMNDPAFREILKKSNGTTETNSAGISRINALLHVSEAAGLLGMNVSQNTVGPSVQSKILQDVKSIPQGTHVEAPRPGPRDQINILPQDARFDQFNMDPKINQLARGEPKEHGDRVIPKDLQMHQINGAPLDHQQNAHQVPRPRTYPMDSILVEKGINLLTPPQTLKTSDGLCDKGAPSGAEIDSMILQQHPKIQQINGFSSLKSLDLITSPLDLTPQSGPLEKKLSQGSKSHCKCQNSKSLPKTKRTSTKPDRQYAASDGAPSIEDVEMNQVESRHQEGRPKITARCSDLCKQVIEEMDHEDSCDGFSSASSSSSVDLPSENRPLKTEPWWMHPLAHIFPKSHLPGYQGYHGYQGYQGYHGYQGYQGHQGYPGFPGFPGFPGLPGLPALPEFPGLPGFSSLSAYQGRPSSCPCGNPSCVVVPVPTSSCGRIPDPFGMLPMSRRYPYGYPSPPPPMRHLYYQYPEFMVPPKQAADISFNGYPSNPASNNVIKKEVTTGASKLGGI